MLGLFRDKKIKIVFVIFVFLMLNRFLVLPVYGLPSTTCNSSRYHTYACDSSTSSRWYCVRSTTTTSSGTSTRYYWSISNCASGQVCSGGSCNAYVCTAGTMKCSGGDAYACSSNSWSLSSDCSYGCSEGSDTYAYCNAYVCTAGDMKCSGGDAYACSSNSWHLSSDCSYGCSEGSDTYASCDAANCSSQGGICIAPGGTYPCPNIVSASGCVSPNTVCCTAKCTNWNATYGGNWQCKYRPYCEAIGVYIGFGGDLMGCTGYGDFCCRLGTAYADECSTNAWCVSTYGSCWTCDGVPIGTSGYTYKKCQQHISTGAAGACGGSNGGSFCDAPTTGLCGTGSLNTSWNGGFNWNCMGNDSGACQNRGATSGTCTATDLPTVNGQCSTSDGACWAGSVSDSGATTTKSDGIYSIWNCNGSCSGSNTGCEYKLCNRVNGSCGSSDGTCSAGSVSDSGATTTKSDGIYSIWNCNGLCSGSNTSCEYKLCNRVDGSCGTATSGSTCTPPTANFCTTTYGNTATATNANTFTWKCNGTCSGVQSPTCTSTRLIINGQCGTANGGNYTSTPAANLCAANNVNTPVQLSGTTYSWTCNRNCNGITVPCSAVYDTAPNFSTVVLKNTSGTVIAPETGGKNHSCDATFAGSKTNLWTITASDANGLADIKQITLRFRSATNTYSYGPTTAVSGAVTFTVDTTSFTVGTYNAEVLIEDQHTPDPPNRGWLDTGRDFKIWDCQVTVDGTIYDNSDNLACVNGSNQGFSNPIPADIQIFTLAYGDKTPGGSTRNMTVVSPKFYSPQKLTWQNQYFLDTINTTNISFLGLFNRSKINDICTPYNDYLYPKVYVDAYSASPKIDIKYSAIMDQKAWFRVKDGSVLVDVEVKNYVPVTCVDNCATTLNGLVWSKKVNLSDDSDESLTSEVQPQPPFKDSYEVLKYDINGGLNVGTTINGSVNWSDIGSTRGVIFVSGNLTIDENVVPGVNDYVFFIVKGKITITENVSQVTGMFFADGLIQVSGQNATQLNITGSLYSKTGITLDRTFNPKRDNNSKPAVEVTFDPNLIFRLPKKLWELYENWTLE